MNRREFISTTTLATASMAVIPFSSFSGKPYANLFQMNPALTTRLNVKFIQNGLLHEEAYEGSCRTGELKDLTFESEQKRLMSQFENLTEELKTVAFADGIELNKTGHIHLYVEKGNPDIMLKEDQLRQFDADADETDVYVVCGAGCSQFSAMKIGERYKKPVILTQAAGWAVDFPPSLRQQGLEGYYTQDWRQTLQLLKLMQVRKAIKETNILMVTNFPDDIPRGVVSVIKDYDFLKSHYGLGFVFVDYEEFFNEMNFFEASNSNITVATEIARGLLKDSVESNMSEEDVAKSVLYYMMVEDQMKKNQCNAFTTECFELCSSMNPWKRRFTPCLAHALNKDRGCPSACERDLNAMLAMIIQMYISNKAVYMGNPDFDIDNNTLTVHHSVASVKMKGLTELPQQYGIQSFTKAGFGATYRIDFNKDVGQQMTIGRFDPTARKMLMTIGNIQKGDGLNGCGCAQRVTLEIPNTKQFFRSIQNYGHHLSLVYGNYSDDINLLANMMGFEVEEVV